MLLIVMYEKQTWRLRPGEEFTFGRAPTSTAVLPYEDRGLSRHAGSFRYQVDSWWVKNESGSSLLYLTGDRGFRVDLPPGMRSPLQQWHIKIRMHGFLDDYSLRLRLPDLDDADEAEAAPAAGASAGAEPAAAAAVRRRGAPESIVTSTHDKLTLNDDDRLVLAARFEEYLTWRHIGEPAPRSAAETAERIGWQSHTVTKRCENIRNRYTLLGVPGLRGPRALEELARLLMSTGVLTADDLRRLPPKADQG
ncbi:MAG TPA: hypothetical protein VH637_24900 [Streptosporangiaceae bacterium]